MLFKLMKEPFSEETISIENEGRHNYTEEYKQLTTDFYIHF